MSKRKSLFTMKYSIRFLLFFILFIQACNQPEPSPYPEIVFQKMSPHPVSGRSTAVSFTINDTGYIALGRYQGGLNDCWAYYPELDSWKQKNNFPGVARVNAMAEVVDQKAYVGLGFSTGGRVYVDQSYLRDLWMYDAANDTWEKKADYPGEADGTPLSSGCVSFVYEKDIYIGAGFNGYTFSNVFWKYNTENDVWTKLKDFKSTSRAIATATSAGGRYFFGTGYHTYNLNDWWEYIPGSDSWLKRQKMPDNGRVNALSFSVNERVFVATGRHFGGSETNGKLFSDLMEYDINKDLWYRRGNLSHARENAIVFVLKGRVYIGLGENDSTVINDLWSFEP